MTLEYFYDLLNDELEEILLKHKDEPFFMENKKDKNVLKSRAFLIQFLEFYGKILDYETYITDGSGDSSCDIIIDSIDYLGNKTYYIVQSKWNIKKNLNKEVAKEDVLQALSEFDTIIKGKKTKTKNVLFNDKLEELTEHIKNNGEIKVIYLTLANESGDVQDNIETFLSTHKKTSFEWVDINKLRVDYINRKYKELDINSPLDKYFNPEEDTIDIEIAQNVDKRSFIHVEKPFEAYVFLIKPSTIHELFDKYGFSLFQKNVRNPLIKSTLNEDIEKTIINNPDFFWYYNNGITAITSLLPDGIRSEAEKIQVSGLQIINGAQTVYSIYKAYENATEVKKKVMDSASLVTFRLLKSGGTDFDLNVTRFTNSQNPVSDRDFVANEEVQLRLQKESFNTSYWYEKRRAEFRNKNIPNIEIISNESFAKCYLAYYLCEPDKIFRSNTKNLIFISHKDDKDGLYEKIFNEKTRFEDMLAAYSIHEIIDNGLNIKMPFFAQSYLILSLFSLVYGEYHLKKYEKEIRDISAKINKNIQKDDIETILQIIKFIYINIYPNILKEENPKDELEHNFKLLGSSGYYEKIKDELIAKFEKLEDIETIDIKDELNRFNDYKKEFYENKKMEHEINNKSDIVVNLSISSVIKKK